MATPTSGKRPAIYQDVLDAPAHKVAEIVDGELVLSPRPAGPHASVTMGLSDEISPPFQRARGGPGGWVILIEPELHLRNDVLVPDLGGWRQPRLPTVQVPYFSIVPDWVCEVLSPSTAKLDRSRKQRIYARDGVGHLWLVDPRFRTVEVMRLHDGKWLTLAVHTDDERVRAEPFDAIEIDLAILWSQLGSFGTRVSESAALYGE